MFSLFFILILGLFTLKDGGQIIKYLPSGACFEDMTFEWSDQINTFTRANLWSRDLLVIFNSFCFDSVMFPLLYLWGMGVFSYHSVFFSLLMNSLTKMLI